MALPWGRAGVSEVRKVGTLSPFGSGRLDRISRSREYDQGVRPVTDAKRMRPPEGGPGMLGGDSKNEYTRPRLAPFARLILKAQRAGRHPNVYLFAGSDAWGRAQRRHRIHGEATALVLPPDCEPEALIWPRLDALTILPGDCDGERFRRLVVALLKAGCRCIAEVRPDPDRPGFGLAPVCHYARADCALEVA